VPLQPQATAQDFEAQARTLERKGRTQLVLASLVGAGGIGLMAYGITVVARPSPTPRPCQTGDLGAVIACPVQAFSNSIGAVSDILARLGGTVLVAGGLGALGGGLALALAGRRNLKGAEHVRSFSLGVGPQGSLGAGVELGF
jgi:hypothetical protein